MLKPMSPSSTSRSASRKRKLPSGAPWSPLSPTGSFPATNSGVCQTVLDPLPSLEIERSGPTNPLDLPVVGFLVAAISRRFLRSLSRDPSACFGETVRRKHCLQLTPVAH